MSLKFANRCTFPLAVGYGDFNGSADTSTMLFTAFYAFMGVSIVSIALAEVLETLDEIHQATANKALEKMADDMRTGVSAVVAKSPSYVQQFSTWTQKSALTRVVRVVLPLMVVGIVGASILVATEHADSGIMTTEDPFGTAFYVSIITGLSVGYGDYSPTSSSGRLIFAFWLVVSVGLVVSSMGQVALIVKCARTTTRSEIVDIKEILLMDESGDGEIDEIEYVMYMLKAQGLVDYRVLKQLEKQFHVLDITGDGMISMEDFPDGMGLERTHYSFNGHVSTELDVVPINGRELTRSRHHSSPLGSRWTRMSL